MKQLPSIISTDPLDLVPETAEADESADPVESSELRPFAVGAAEHGQRLDRALAVLVPEFSRNYLQQLIEAGAVELEGRTVLKPSATVRAGQAGRIELRPTPQSQAFRPETMDIVTVHEDEHLLVVDKPAGLPVHRGPKGGANLEASFDGLQYGLPRPPVLAHRLDRDTSGCLVLGRHRKATASLGLLFKHGKIGKTYWAVIEGGPAEDEGTIDMPLGRLNVERGWWQKPDPDGQKAVTNWKVRGRGDGLCWLALEPVTGRTHQLRVHTSAMGWPIVGDNIYGNGPRFGEPILHLHSREIVIPISKNKEPVRVVAPAPEHMRERLRLCGWNGE